MKTLKEMNMKTMMLLGALMLSLTISAVEYQTYRPSGRQAGYSVYTTATTSRPQGTDFRSTSRYGACTNSCCSHSEENTYRGIGGISTAPAIGGNGTTYNPSDAASVSARGPHRVLNPGFELDTDECEEFVDFNHDGYCDYCGAIEASHGASTGGTEGGNAGTPGNSTSKDDMIGAPIGSPVWPLLLLAVAYGAVATLRRCRRREA